MEFCRSLQAIQEMHMRLLRAMHLESGVPPEPHAGPHCSSWQDREAET